MNSETYDASVGRCMPKKQYKSISAGLNRAFGFSLPNGDRRFKTTALVSLGALLYCLAPTVTRCQDKVGPHEARKVGVDPEDSPQTIPLYMSTNRMLVMLRVGGIGPFPVVFDTGTDGNVLDLHLANKLGLPKTGPSQAIDSTGSHLPGHETFIKDATLSGAPFANGVATAAPYDLPDEVGVVGPNSFSGKLVRVEGRKNRLVIVSKSSGTIPHCDASPYVEVEGGFLPSVKLTIDGHSFIAEIDTGNNSALDLPTSLIPSLALRAPPVKIGTSTGAAGTQDVYRGVLAGSLEIGGVIQDSSRQVLFLNHSLPNVGLPLLRGATIILDPAERRDWLFFDDASEAACATTVPSRT